MLCLRSLAARKCFAETPSAANRFAKSTLHRDQMSPGSDPTSSPARGITPPANFAAARERQDCGRIPFFSSDCKPPPGTNLLRSCV